MLFNYAVFPGFRASPGFRNLPDADPGSDGIGPWHETRCPGFVDDVLPEQAPFEGRRPSRVTRGACPENPAQQHQAQN